MPISSQRPFSEPDGCIQGVSLSRSSSTSKKSYEERCVDPVQETPQSRGEQSTHKAHPKDANWKESETIGFIPGSAEPGAHSCGLCASPGSCRSFVCSVLTCGLYRVCQRTVLAPCLEPEESSPDEPEKVNLQEIKPGDRESSPSKEDGSWPEDIHFHGVRVDTLTQEDSDVTTKPRVYSERRPSPPSFSLDDDNWGYSNEDVDSLIAKKLLELYSEYQIEELAKCTSDSVFLKKTSQINQLISELAEEHKLEQQDAECRLVRGIIRISTRKSKRRPPYTKATRTLSDSGNETMKDSDSFSFSNNNDYNVQISEETRSDIYARKMRWNSEVVLSGHTSGSSTTHSLSHTEVVSSGAPLLQTYVRT
ncbi:keratinocyte differentiation factor 1 isoform X1 [Hypomesus transpacificus]|uniref:keratinocyte differentiation factor 1 isoform X1 n=1 Tax=Hypomesus transpacificus TaxID=137520 RepID=UPI001F07AA59|nr:keratinocyte differentiation factor 1 isoform X1 [Hypomesus transpacificus]